MSSNTESVADTVKVINSILARLQESFLAPNLDYALSLSELKSASNNCVRILTTTLINFFLTMKGQHRSS